MGLGGVMGSHDLTCPSQLGSESSTNGVMVGGTEGGEAGIKRGLKCVRGET